MMGMHTVETTFKLSYTDEQYVQAKRFVEDMKKHKNRIFWVGKEGKSDDELILGHLAHRILSGFYNAYDGYGSSAILDMMNSKINGGN
jgi:tripartite-type tricarboxylate transporter receptor subunit TctC